MFQTTKPQRKLTSTSDIARLIGLRANAAPSQIARHFGRLTNFDTNLEIKVVPLTESHDETWEIRLIKALPRVRVELRKGNRGEWLTEVDGIPDGVRRFFQLRPGRDGGIETLRGWRAWERTNWSKVRGRRLRARCGEIQAVVEIQGVERQTGECRTHLRIEPVLDECMEDPGIVELALPCTAGALMQAVTEIRAACLPAAA